MGVIKVIKVTGARPTNPPRPLGRIFGPVIPATLQRFYGSLHTEVRDDHFR